MQDIWDFKDPQYPRYPTEKNSDLLETVILASSMEESIVLDFFCGSGTTLEVAQKLKRRWIGVDSSEIAISVVRERLDSCVPFCFIESHVSDFVPELVLCEDELQEKKISKPPKKKIIDDLRV